MNWQLGVDQAPLAWRRTRLRSFLTRSRQTGRPDLPLLSVNLPDGVVPRREGDGRPAPAEDLSAYQVVRRGDLVMNQLGKPHGALGVSQHDGIISPAYFVARIAKAAHPRFVHHLLRTRRYISEYERRGKYMPPSQFDISWDQFRSIPVALPSVSEQRAIADFLDAETARFDALITKKRQIMDLLREHYRAEADILLRRDASVSLRRVADLLPGFMFASDDFGKDFDGPRLVRGVNVGLDRLRWDDEVRLRPDCAVPTRYRLAEGDLVLGMDRPFINGGTRIAEVDAEVAGALLVQRVCRVRPASADWGTVLRSLLGSRRFVAHVEPDLTGVSVPHLSDSQIGTFPVPQMSEQEISVAASRLRQQERRMTQLAGRLQQQVGLLQEHRQALITAAVCGEVDVPKVAA